MSSLDDLKDFERELDEMIEALPIVGLPLRCFLSCYFAAVDAMLRGPRLSGSGTPNIEIGLALVSRLSYLVPLLGKFKQDEQPSAQNIVEIFNEDLAAEVTYIMSYAHFCELMPEVHRGRWHVDRDGSAFVLRHPDPSFASAETRDVVLAELALQFMIPPPPSNHEVFDHFVTLEELDQRFVKLIGVYTQYFMGAAFEESALSATAFEHALGVREDEFLRFRSVWLAIAEFCLGMADAVERRAKHEGREADPVFIGELYEWVGPLMKQPFLDATAMQLSGLSRTSYDALMSVFSFDLSAGTKIAGDGFIPPLLRVENCYLFSPHIVRAMMASRNVLYAVNKRSRKRFDELVSSTLEPTLIEDATAVFRTFDGVSIVPNVPWTKGEIDLLVFDEVVNTALHVQAKAPIPVEGARMVRALEDHVCKGLAQLAAFRSLSSEERDRILSRALGRDVRGVRTLDVVLSRTCLGTQQVWKAAAGIAVVNVPLLREIRRRMHHAGERLDRFTERAREALDEIVADVVLEWREGTVTLGENSVRVPLLQTDQRKLNAYRMRLLPRAGLPYTADGIR